MIQLLYNKKTIKIVTKISNNKTFVFNYSKFFIRNNFNNKDFILDNSFEISSGLNKNEYNNIGYSVVLNKFLFKHKLDKNLKFYWFNPNINLHQNLSVYSTSINIKNFVFFTKLVKGGIECYSNGFKGFLSKEQLTSIVKQQKSCILTSKLYFLFNLKNNSRFFYLKAPVQIAKFTLNTPLKAAYAKKNKGLNTINNKFNIIFSCPKNLLTYENKKNNKKNRKPYSKKKS